MRTMAVVRGLLAAFVAATSLAAAAQSNAVVRGGFHDTGPEGYDETLAFECRGMPTCTGTYSITVRHERCTTFNTFSGTFVITGLDLASAAAFSGSVTLSGVRESVSNAGQPCVLGSSSKTESLAYTGTWNPATGSGALVATGSDEGGAFTVSFAFTATVDAPPPVFEMTVMKEITATTANAAAQIQFRPQDVGSSGSIFVFAYAPRAKLSGLALAKAGDVPKADGDCVVAQLDSSGRLVARSASQLNAFFSGTFSSQGAAVDIMNNVSTPVVSGATFYVGYGSNAAAMLDQGVFRDAVLVPGTGACPLLPMQTSLWWNPRESGWGLNLNHQGNTLFGTLFTYDANRAPLWLVMSAGAMQPDGRSFVGDLYRTTGPAFNAQPFTPIGPANVTTVGRMTVLFNDANSASLTYTVNGTQVTKPIQRQVYGSRASNCMPASGSRASSTNYQDLWWNAAESGWGLNIAHQDNTLFATLFTYDAAGRDLWLVMSAGQRQADGSYSGELYRTNGSAFNANPVVPTGPGDVAAVGTMRLRFNNGEGGELTYSYNGTTVTKNITRQVFASPAFACQ